MYDLILCVLATTKNKRLEQFKKIGYKPVSKESGFKTKVVFLQHNEEKPLFLDDEEEWHNCDESFQNRFVEYLQNTEEEFRWIMQVDDDSCTDLKKTIEKLDHYYDYEDSVMLTSSSAFVIDDIAYLNRDKDELHLSSFRLDRSLQKILKECGDKCFEHTDDVNVFDVVPYIHTGWEHAILSKKGLEKIKKYEKLNYFIDRCKELNPKFSDQVPFVLARLAKVPISNCDFLSPLANFEEYTVINKTGRFTHIHHVADYLDQKELLEEFITKKINFENKNQVKKTFESFFENTCWMFYVVSQAAVGLSVDDPRNKLVSRCALRFKDDGKIEKLRLGILAPLDNCDALNINESFFQEEGKSWECGENQIVLRDLNNPANFAAFEKQENGTYIFNAQNNQFYIFSRIDKNDLMYFAHNKLNNPKRLSWPIQS